MAHAKLILKKLDKERPDLQDRVQGEEAKAFNIGDGDGFERWEAIGRAFLKPGLVTPYLYGVHHGGNDATLFSHSSTALTIGSPDALRFHCIESLESAELRRALAEQAYRNTHPKKKHEKYPLEPREYDVYQLGMGAKKQRFGKGEAKITFEIVASSDKKKTTSLKGSFVGPPGCQAPGRKDPMVVEDVAFGTNIHRAHGLSFSNGKLKGKGRPHAVGDYSEGCQVFPEFDQYTLLIRLAAVHRKLGCGASGCDCSFIKADPAGKIGPGEQKLIDWKGLPYFSIATAAVLGKEAKGKQTEIGKLTARQKQADKIDASLEENSAAQQQAAPGSKKLQELQEAANRLEEKRDAAWTDADDEALATAQDELETLNGIAAELRDWASEQMVSDVVVPGPSDEAIARRTEFISNRTGILGADYLRCCDIAPKADACPVRFDYVLLEVPLHEAKRVEDLFGRAENSAWDGTLCPGENEE